jgi:hypothetical protein
MGIIEKESLMDAFKLESSFVPFSNSSRNPYSYLSFLFSYESTAIFNIFFV